MTPESPQTQFVDVPEPAAIKQWATEQGILILAHSYQDGFLQEAAHFVGDSLELARKAAEEQPDAICFCGVHFMAETAKVLCPDADVFVPDMEAGCSLADSCKVEDLKKYQDHLEKKNGQRPVTISYVNCTAAVKAASDIYSPVTGAVIEINPVLEEQPEAINQSPYVDGWLFRVKLSNHNELDDMLDRDEYLLSIEED